jgi:hypothetical protein
MLQVTAGVVNTVVMVNVVVEEEVVVEVIVVGLALRLVQQRPHLHLLPQTPLPRRMQQPRNCFHLL